MDHLQMLVVTNYIWHIMKNFEYNTEWFLGFQFKYSTGRIKKAPVVLFIVDKRNGWADAY